MRNIACVFVSVKDLLKAGDGEFEKVSQTVAGDDILWVEADGGEEQIQRYYKNPHLLLLSPKLLQGSLRIVVSEQKVLPEGPGSFCHHLIDSIKPLCPDYEKFRLYAFIHWGGQDKEQTKALNEYSVEKALPLEFVRLTSQGSSVKGDISHVHKALLNGTDLLKPLEQYLDYKFKREAKERLYHLNMWVCEQALVNNTTEVSIADVEYLGTELLATAEGLISGEGIWGDEKTEVGDGLCREQYVKHGGIFSEIMERRDERSVTVADANAFRDAAAKLLDSIDTPIYDRHD